MKLPSVLVAAIVLAGFVAAGAARAEDPAATLAARYQRVVDAGAPKLADLPLYVDTRVEGSFVRAQVHGLLAQPYEVVAGALRDGRQWCEIALAHFAVKACTAQAQAAATQLTMYFGRRHYQAPEQARALSYELRIDEQRPDYLRARFVRLEEERDGTTDPFRLEVAALAGGGTLMAVTYANELSPLMRALAAAYFATFGRHKIGFSLVPAGRAGAGEPVRGMVGAIERNVVRGYFAIEAYFATRDEPAATRFERQAAHWFDLTERYPEQLRELSREEYLAAKRLERAQSERRQRELSAPSDSGA